MRFQKHFPALLLVLLAACPPGAAAQPADTWSVIIPEAFPNVVYTWRFNANGTYQESASNAVTGESVQETFYGHWTLKGARMLVQQDDSDYVFDGAGLGNSYNGSLMEAGKKISRFCGRKGKEPPETCDAGIPS